MLSIRLQHSGGETPIRRDNCMTPDQRLSAGLFLPLAQLEKIRTTNSEVQGKILDGAEKLT